MRHRLCFLVGEWCCHLLEQRRVVCVFSCPGYYCRKGDSLVTISIERKTSGHKTKALASNKRVPQLFLAIVSSYAVVFRDGARHTVRLFNGHNPAMNRSQFNTFRYQKSDNLLNRQILQHERHPVLEHTLISIERRSLLEPLLSPTHAPINNGDSNRISRCLVTHSSIGKYANGYVITTFHTFSFEHLLDFTEKFNCRLFWRVFFFFNL